MSVCGALARWNRAGKPVRSPERVAELLSICQACDKFTGSHCRRCGCPVNGHVDEPTHNKLALATERCPLDPPHWPADA